VLQLGHKRVGSRWGYGSVLKFALGPLHPPSAPAPA
jgi:hypothetical protein